MRQQGWQDLRTFLRELENADPQAIARIREPVELHYDATAIAFEFERRGQNPVLLFGNVRGSKFPVLMNLFGSRGRYAFALGVEESRLASAAL